MVELSTNIKQAMLRHCSNVAQGQRARAKGTGKARAMEDIKGVGGEEGGDPTSERRQKGDSAERERERACERKSGV